jgi:hypothetical protein
MKRGAFGPFRRLRGGKRFIRGRGGPEGKGEEDYGEDRPSFHFLPLWSASRARKYYSAVFV